MKMRRLHSVFVSVFVLVAGCGADSLAPPSGFSAPVLAEISSASELVPGSLVLATANGVPPIFEPVLALSSGGKRVELSRVDGAAAGELLFVLDEDAFEAFGPGTHAMKVSLEAGRESAAIDVTLVFAYALDFSLSTLQAGASVYRNEVVLVRATGLLAPTEGSVDAIFEGTFEDDRGAETPVSAEIPVLPADRFARDRGILTLSTALGGIRPGAFDGTLSLRRTLSGESTTTEPLDVSFDFEPPTLFALEPAEASLGQYVVLRGGGFVGCASGCDEVTTMTIEGTFTPQGGSPAPFGPVEIVPEYVSGAEVRFVMDTEVAEGELISSLFGAREGEWQGNVFITTSQGVESITSDTVAARFTLAPVRQVVHVRFLPGFYEALLLFGLAEASQELEAGIRERIASLYADYNVDIRLEEPTDFAQGTGYAVVEIGGTDPNGKGLFGYDNSPGKDVGNVRLFDTIGGANAETQADGYAGYGGVFIESFLYFSSHPELPTSLAISDDPLFDEIFDPVRSSAATRAELRGEGEASRVSEVARAVRALSNIIGETTAHELGHSLGLSSPYSSPGSNVFHDPGDEPGCLMESGGSRPVGERAGEPGYEEARFCYDTDYLSLILARP
jgi:hypothetical protein